MGSRRLIPAAAIVAAALLTVAVAAGCGGEETSVPATSTAPAHGRPTVLLFTQPG